MHPSSQKARGNFQILDRVFSALRVRYIRPLLFPEAIICDLGCGREGKFLRDVSPSVQRCIGFDGAVIPFSQGNIEMHTQQLEKEIPLPDCSVDIVTMLAVLEHLEHHRDILREARRILRPGGTLIITSPTVVAKPFLEFLSFRLGLLSEDEIRDHKRYFIKLNLLDDLTSSGFLSEDIRMKYFELGFNLLAVTRKQ